MGRVISKSRQEAILKDYVAGINTAVIAEKHGVSLSYPTVLARRTPGVQMRGHGNRPRPKTVPEPMKPAAPFTPEVSEEPQTFHEFEIKRLSAKGLGRTAIAALLRCSYREVEAALPASGRLRTASMVN